MRYYLIDSDNNETKIDFTYCGKGEDLSHHFSSDNEDVFIRQLGDKYFISSDKKSWKKLAVQDSLDTLVVNSQTLKVYRGYKPSGISNSSEGDLITQMPGKVIKLMTSEGDTVSKGDTLLILEAMKMENEIKSKADGIVKSINVSEGQNLEVGQVMIEIE